MGNSHYYGNYNDWLTKFSERVSKCRKQSVEDVSEEYEAELTKSKLLVQDFIDRSKSAGFTPLKSETIKLARLESLTKNVMTDLMAVPDSSQASWTLQVLVLFNEQAEPQPVQIGDDSCSSFTKQASAKYESSDLETLKALNKWLSSANIATVYCPKTAEFLSRKAKPAQTKLDFEQLASLYQSLTDQGSR